MKPKIEPLRLKCEPPIARLPDFEKEVILQTDACSDGIGAIILQEESVEGKGENYQVCSVQYCVQQLCTVRCTHI